MKNKAALAILAGFLLSFVACDDGKERDGSADAESSFIFLASDMFNTEKIGDARKSIPDSSKRKSKEEFLEAIDIYRNQKNANGSIKHFEESILMYPDAKSYYEMGNAYMDIKNYDKALQSYEVATQLEYNPLSKVEYNMACAYSLKEDNESAIEHLEKALENGYANGKHLLKDKDLENARTHYRFTDLYREYFSDQSNYEEGYFTLFANSFPRAGLPFIMDEKTAGEYDTEKYIAYDFEKFVPGMADADFGREVSNEFHYVAKVYEDKRYVLLVYNDVEVISYLAPARNYLVSYDKKGNILDRMLFACTCSPEEVVTGRINHDLSIEQKTYQNSFKYGPKEKGYDNNPVENQELIKTERFFVMDDGTFKAIEEAQESSTGTDQQEAVGSPRP